MHHSQVSCCASDYFLVLLHVVSRISSSSVLARTTRGSLSEFLMLSEGAENLVWQRKRDPTFQFTQPFNQRDFSNSGTWGKSN